MVMKEGIFPLCSQRTKKGAVMAGTLYLCPTPIGNLEDMTFRAIRTLKEVDLIAAEDTRHTIKLLNHFEIKTPMTSYHEFNKYDKADYLVSKLLEGLNIAVVTDAGTPGISDPGEVVVKKAYEAGITVTSLPGACACITGLTMSGRDTRRFCFEAFLPTDKKERKEILEELKEETRTTILYEAPHRLLKTVGELLEVLGERNVTLLRELTKKHETALLTTLSGILEFYKEEEPKGECVLVMEGVSREEIVKKEQEVFEKMSFTDHVNHYIELGESKKDAMKKVALDRGISKREVYQALLNEE